MSKVEHVLTRRS